MPLPGSGTRPPRLRVLLRFVWVVLVGMRNGALRASVTFTVHGREQEADENHTAEDMRRVSHPWREEENNLMSMFPRLDVQASWVLRCVKRRI